MSMLERPSREQRSRQRRRSPVLRALLVVVALALAFLLGIAFARTLDERPEDGRTVTSVRTLTPLPQEVPARTVTVTVTQP
ncbi:MAG: hypothetical protein ACRDPV_03540 [Gaiellaceae bacterium]